MDIINNKIRELRKEKRITQEELAKVFNTTQDTISLWERGKSTPDVYNLILLSKIFDVTTDYLLGLEDDLGNKIKDEKYECLEYGEMKSSIKHTFKNK